MFCLLVSVGSCTFVPVCCTLTATDPLHRIPLPHAINCHTIVLASQRALAVQLTHHLAIGRLTETAGVDNDGVMIM